MKAIPLCRSAVIFAGFLWAATIAGAGPDQAQTSTKPDVATPAQTEAPAAQSDPGVWRHFGPNNGRPKVGPGKTVPRRNLVANRLADLEKQMWALVNRDRLDPATSAETGGRAQSLRWNEELAAVARAHSRNMLEQRFFDHVDREGRTLSARIKAAGIPWRALGENIAINGTVPGAEAAFMNEPRFQNNHRGNILNAKYTDVGIGIVQGPNGSLYITQDFLAIPANGGGVTSAPQPTYRPDPGYTPAAKKAKIEGEIALSIAIDAQGNVTEVKQTSEPLGKGLDESAAATVRTWKFEPARRDGVPVAVNTLVKVKFNLFR